MRGYKVRFNLGKGDRYMKWQVKDAYGNVEHFEPSEVTIHMAGAKLKNVAPTALKIHNGAHKSVCAWVECEEVVVTEVVDQKEFDTEVSYNPRVQPFWISEGEGVDNEVYGQMTSKGRKLFIDKNQEV